MTNIVGMDTIFNVVFLKKPKTKKKECAMFHDIPVNDDTIWGILTMSTLSRNSSLHVERSNSWGDKDYRIVSERFQKCFDSVCHYISWKKCVPVKALMDLSRVSESLKQYSSTEYDYFLDEASEILDVFDDFDKYQEEVLY